MKNRLPRKKKKVLKRRRQKWMKNHIDYAVDVLNKPKSNKNLYNSYNGITPPTFCELNKLYGSKNNKYEKYKIPMSKELKDYLLMNG